MTTVVRRARVGLLASLTALALVVGPGVGVAAAADGETVTSFDARIDVDAQGDLHVTETIAYVFAGGGHHGLQRDLRTRSRRPGDDRIHPVSQVAASSPSGAPAQVTVTGDDAHTVIRVGDPQRTVAGRQTYVLHYTVGAAVDRVTAPTQLGQPHDELYWQITGFEWGVPVGRASAEVVGPQPAFAARCSAGREGSTRPCAGAAGPTATFSAENLRPGEGLTVAVAYPIGTVAGARPVSGVPEQAEPTTLGKSVGFALLFGLVAGLVILGQRLVAWAGAESSTGPALPEPHTAPAVSPSPVALDVPGLPLPPPGLRPGHVALLREGRAGTVAVTATLADLAVRGYLRVEEVPADGGPSSSWRLVAQEPPFRETLLRHERTLLATLFTGRDDVTVEDLRGARHLAEVQRQLFDDAVARGWFPRDTHARLVDRRTLGRGLAAGGFVVAVVADLSGAIAAFLLGLALLAGGLIAALDDRSARPTPFGAVARSRVDRFRSELAAAATDRGSLDDAEEVFGRMLPFAIAVGLAADWSDRFRSLAAVATVFEAAVESASSFMTSPTEASSGSSWWGHSHGSDSFGSSSSSSGFDGSSCSSGDGGGGGSSW